MFDSFNRADSSTSLGTTDTGQTWTYVDLSNSAGGALGILSNLAYPIGGGLNTIRSAHINSGVADCIIKVKLTAIGATRMGYLVGLIFRYIDATHWYALIVDKSSGNIALFKAPAVANNLPVALTSWTRTINDGDTLDVELAGTSITPTHNGTALSTFVDSTHTTGTKHGLYVENLGFSSGATSNTDARWNDFEIVVPSMMKSRIGQSI